MNAADNPIEYLDGHCQSHGKPDQFHALCPGGFRSQFGVEFRCSCSNHQSAQTPTVDRDSSPSDGTIGNESGPESALTDRGLATVSTKPKGA